MPQIPIYNAPTDRSLALFDHPTWRPTWVQRIGLVLVAAGLGATVVAWTSGLAATHAPVFSVLSLGGISLGGLVYALGGLHEPEGVRTEGTMLASSTARGAVGWVLALVLTGLYLCLYIQPALLSGLIPLGDPLSQFIRNRPATLDNGGHWFLYGTIYTLAVVVMGVRAAVRYRHSRYHLIRTASVTFVQLGLAFLLPQLLVRLGEPEIYPSYFWPLDWDLIFPSSVRALQEAGGVGVFMLVWGTFLTVIATPVLTYFFGKRWYCSWVCGCGGLAETAGDPFRHLSPKGTRAWRIERWMVHGVLVFVILVTAILWIAAAANVAWIDELAGVLSGTYGFWIGAMFAGVAGVGFYPVLGSRIWCRYGCPMAAILGLQQRFFSRFRITTNGGQCISCGQCSAYCEMGIDVKAYAQRGQNIVRASCVGCGICATVCPRGVLKLENGPETSGVARAGVPVNNLIGDLEILDPEWTGAPTPLA